MEKKYIIANLGSRSKKYRLYLGDVLVFQMHFEEDGGKYIKTIIEGKKKNKENISSDNYSLAFKTVVEKSGIPNAVGMRIVAPGTYFTKHRQIDSEYIERLKSAIHVAPLHIQGVLLEISQIRKIFPDMQIYGISDSAFHATMPEFAKRYAIRDADTRKFDIYRFGYHGLSVASVLRSLGYFSKKVIVCHLGGGSSVTAVQAGKSIETSMGFTPLEGVVMSTRGGNIDDGVVLHLARLKNMTFEDMRGYLSNNSGLLGISEISSSVKELFNEEKRGNKQAGLALDILAHSIKKYIGAYVTELGGLDTIVFTGTIGERSFLMRKRICEGLECIGAKLSERKNKKTDSVFRSIHSFGSKVKIIVIPTDEMGEMARIIRGLEKI